MKVSFRSRCFIANHYGFLWRGTCHSNGYNQLYNFELFISIPSVVFCNLLFVIAKRLSTTLSYIILFHGFTVIACNFSLLFQFRMTFTFVVCIIVICGPSNATFLRTIIRKAFWIWICTALFLIIDIEDLRNI